MTGVIPRRPQVLDRGRRGPPRCFYPWPGLLLPHLHHAVVALDRAARADLAGPAAAAQQVPDPRHGVLLLELRRHQIPDPGQCPPLVSPPGRQRPGAQRHIQRGQLLRSDGYARPAHLAFLSLFSQAARSAYTGWVTAKEQLQQLVAEMGEEQASRALGLLRPLVQDKPDNGQAPRLPEFVGSGDSGRSDLSERVDELLAEGFGR
jgi:hypothetical protein